MAEVVDPSSNPGIQKVLNYLLDRSEAVSFEEFGYRAKELCSLLSHWPNNYSAIAAILRYQAKSKAEEVQGLSISETNDFRFLFVDGKSELFELLT